MVSPRMQINKITKRNPQSKFDTRRRSNIFSLHMCLVLLDHGSWDFRVPKIGMNQLFCNGSSRTGAMLPMFNDHGNGYSGVLRRRITDKPGMILEGTPQFFVIKLFSGLAGKNLCRTCFPGDLNAGKTDAAGSTTVAMNNF